MLQTNTLATHSRPEPRIHTEGNRGKMEEKEHKNTNRNTKRRLTPLNSDFESTHTKAPEVHLTEERMVLLRNVHTRNQHREGLIPRTQP